MSHMMRGKLYFISETDATEARRRGYVRGFNGVVDLGSTLFQWDLTFKVSASWVQSLALSRFVWVHAAAKTSQSDLTWMRCRPGGDNWRGRRTEAAMMCCQVGPLMGVVGPGRAVLGWAGLGWRLEKWPTTGLIDGLDKR